MKTLALIAILGSSAILQGQTTPKVNYITPDQVKKMWVKKLVPPRTMDKDYTKIIKSYQAFIADIKAGNRDLDAQETAAIYNKGKAVAAGDAAMAQTFESELSRIAKAKSEAAALAQAKERDETNLMYSQELQRKLRQIDSNLRDINNRIGTP